MTQYSLDGLASADDGIHLIHKTDAGCPLLPPPPHRMDLGEHRTALTALIRAANHFERVNGCYYCASAAHVKSTAFVSAAPPPVEGLNPAAFMATVNPSPTIPLEGKSPSV